MVINISIPFPISANAMYRNVARTLKSERYRKWIVEAAWTIKSQTKSKMAGDYKLTMLVVPPDRRRRDLDNLLKSASDALGEAGVIKNDQYCRWIEARWVETGEPCQITLEDL